MDVHLWTTYISTIFFFVASYFLFISLTFLLEDWETIKSVCVCVFVSFENFKFQIQCSLITFIPPVSTSKSIISLKMTPPNFLLFLFFNFYF